MRRISMQTKSAIPRSPWDFRWISLCLLLTACAAVPPAAQVPVLAESDVMFLTLQAEVDGRRLFDAYQSGDKAQTAEIDAARGAITDLCAYTYKPVVVSEAKPGIDYVYFIAASDTPDDVVWGKHYRVELDKISGKALGVSSSTQSCLAMPAKIDLPQGAQVAELAVTHLLSPVPSEFHVFLSLLHPQGLSVTTSYGVWKVEAGTITLLGKH
jgi:hypothetical protein